MSQDLSSDFIHFLWSDETTFFKVSFEEWIFPCTTSKFDEKPIKSFVECALWQNSNHSLINAQERGHQYAFKRCWKKTQNKHLFLRTERTKSLIQAGEVIFVILFQQMFVLLFFTRHPQIHRRGKQPEARCVHWCFLYDISNWCHGGKTSQKTGLWNWWS